MSQKDERINALQEQMDRHTVEVAVIVLDAVIEHLGLDLTPEQYLGALLEAARREVTTYRVSPKLPDLFEQAVEIFADERRRDREELPRRVEEAGRKH